MSYLVVDQRPNYISIPEDDAHKCYGDNSCACEKSQH